MGDRDCTCGETFRTGEDFRDHLPCDGTPEEQAYRRGYREATKGIVPQVGSVRDGKWVKLTVKMGGVATGNVLFATEVAAEEFEDALRLVSWVAST